MKKGKETEVALSPTKILFALNFVCMVFKGQAE